jgi:hypothetical protein
MAQALIQHAREEARQARQNLPIGIVMIVLGAGMVAGAVLYAAGLSTVFIAGFGFLLIPGGAAVLVKAFAAIANEKRVVREHELPKARVVD